jgi:hypothetical protein
LTIKDCKHGVRGNRSNKARNHGGEFECRGAIEYFAHKKRSPQRRAKDSTNPTRSTGEHQQTPLLVAQTKFLGEKRSEASANLCDRPLSTG